MFLDFVRTGSNSGLLVRYPSKLHLCSVASVLTLTCAGSLTLNAATIIVSNTADDGSGSLRAALASAANGDTIDATGVSGTILLTTGELLITNSLSINGPGPASLTIDGNFPTTTNSVFNVQKDLTNGATVTLSGLTITNGYASDGGGIHNYQSALTVSNCIVSGNFASICGGGIFSYGGPSGNARLTIINSSITGNSAYLGGGIDVNGEAGSITLTLLGSMISSNTAAGPVGGGAIKNDGSPSGSATTLITNCTLNGNSSAGNGGAIQNDGVQGSATLIVVNSTLSGNSVSGNGRGGAIFNDGGVGGNSTVTLINATVSSNSAGSVGGGICNGGFNGGGTTTLILLSSTLSSNSASAIGTIYNSGTLQVGNTILNTGGSGSNISHFSGTVISQGFNISSDSFGGFLTNATDQTNINPLLGPLQDNGGPVFTHALLAGSPATDKGKNLSGAATDSRGFPRTFDDPAIANAAGGDGTDIGAYEAFALRITAVEQLGDALRLSFTSLPGMNYELQNRTDLISGWNSILGSIPGNGSIAQTTVTNLVSQPQQFYRIHQLP